MAEVLAASAVPFRPSGLALLLEQRKNNDLLRVYFGNILWSLLASVFSFAKQKIEIPTCGDYFEMVFEGLTMEELEARRKEQDKKEAQSSILGVIKMINRFSKPDEQNGPEVEYLKKKGGIS